jgi:GNAT superfamily N-acetyltransferase
VEITAVRPDDSAAIAAGVRFANELLKVDAPWMHAMTPAYAAGFLAHGWDGEPATAYLCSVGGELVATAELWTSERDNRHHAALEVVVHPERRRKGFGREVLERMEAEVRRRGRTTLGLSGWESDALRAFAARHGYAEVSRAINRRQLLADVDRADLARLVEAAAPYAADYVLERWPRRTPERDLPALAELTAAINDAPTDEMDVEDEVFDADRIRAYEAATEARGERMHRLVARHLPTGELAGQTVVAVEVDRPQLGHQHDTSVVRAHRGHRLGLLLKAGMLDWFAETEPALAEVETWNAESNDHMIGVNRLLGYTVLGRELVFERKV